MGWPEAFVIVITIVCLTIIASQFINRNKPLSRACSFCNRERFGVNEYRDDY